MGIILQRLSVWSCDTCWRLSASARIPSSPMTLTTMLGNQKKKKGEKSRIEAPENRNEARIIVMSTIEERSTHKRGRCMLRSCTVAGLQSPQRIGLESCPLNKQTRRTKVGRVGNQQMSSNSPFETRQRRRTSKPNPT